MVKDEIYFLDCPGLDNNNKTLEYPNQTAIHYVTKHASSVLIFLVISSDYFVNKGTLFLTQITAVARLLSSQCSIG